MADARFDHLFVLARGAFVERALPWHALPRQGGGVPWSSDHIGVLASLVLIDLDE